MLTSVDVNILPQSLILLEVLQEVLVLSEGGKASQLGSLTFEMGLGLWWDVLSIPLIIRVHALSVSGHLLQLPVPALHPPGAVVALLDQNLQQKHICRNIITFPEQVKLPLGVSVSLTDADSSPHQGHGEGSSCSGSRR